MADRQVGDGRSPAHPRRALSAQMPASGVSFPVGWLRRSRNFARRLLALGLAIILVTNAILAVVHEEERMHRLLLMPEAFILV